MKEKKKEYYTSEDKNCTHCGGYLSDHSAGERIIRWCDDCGSNNPKFPPNVTLEFN